MSSEAEVKLPRFLFLEDDQDILGVYCDAIRPFEEDVAAFTTIPKGVSFVESLLPVRLDLSRQRRARRITVVTDLKVQGIVGGIKNGLDFQRFIHEKLPEYVLGRSFLVTGEDESYFPEEDRALIKKLGIAYFQKPYLPVKELITIAKHH